MSKKQRKFRPSPPKYDPLAWSALINAARQPRCSYRYALFVPDVKNVKNLPPAGTAGRWFLLPHGALLLRKNTGRVQNMTDLAKEVLRIGPFTLRQVQPLKEKTQEKRERLRAVRAARRELRRTRVPDPPALPNEGRAVRFGERLSMAVNADFVRARCNDGERLARRATGRKIGEFCPEHLARQLNNITHELEEVGRFVWCDVGQLRRWNKTQRTVFINALTRSAIKPKRARRMADRMLKKWNYSKPSQSRRTGKKSISAA